jgi:hypothetical protein
VDWREFCDRARQLGTESPDHDEGAEALTQTASSHCKSPLFGLDDINDSDEDLARSLRKKAALIENIAKGFHGANGDIEPCDSKPEVISLHPVCKKWLGGPEGLFVNSVLQWSLRG